MIRGQVVGKGTREETVIEMQATEECYSVTMTHLPWADHRAVCWGFCRDQDRRPLVLQELLMALRVTEWEEHAGWRDVNEAGWRGQMTSQSEVSEREEFWFG